MNRRATANAALGPQVAAEPTGEAACDVQTEAGTVSAGSSARPLPALEDGLEVVRRDAGPTIIDLQHDTFAVLTGAHFHRALRRVQPRVS